jgi:hypothetical protein
MLPPPLLLLKMPKMNTSKKSHAENISVTSHPPRARYTPTVFNCIEQKHNLQ